MFFSALKRKCLRNRTLNSIQFSSIQFNSVKGHTSAQVERKRKNNEQSITSVIVFRHLARDYIYLAALQPWLRSSLEPIEEAFFLHKLQEQVPFPDQ